MTHLHCNECGVLFPADMVAPVEAYRKGHTYDETHRWMYCLFCMEAKNSAEDFRKYMRLRKKRERQRDDAVAARVLPAHVEVEDFSPDRH